MRSMTHGSHSRSLNTRSRRLRLETLEQRSLLSAMPYGAGPEDTSEFMMGTVHVTVVFLESDGTIDPSTEDWTAQQIQQVKTRITQGLNWWEETLALENSAHTVDFSIDFTHADTPVLTPYEPISRTSDDIELWASSFLDAVGMNTPADYSTDLTAFNHQQRLAAGTNWAFTIIINNSTNDSNNQYANGAGAWANPGGPCTVLPSNRSATTVAHEVGHIFYALDEYAGGRSYFDQRGYYNTQNLNGYDDNPDPSSRVPSMMVGSPSSNVFRDHSLSEAAEQMIGWRDSDGDGIYDLLDVPLELQGSGRFNPLTGSYEFQGTATVGVLENLNTTGLGRGVTINRVDHMQYRVDDGPWIDWPMIYDSYEATVNMEIGPLPEGQHDIQIRAVGDLDGITSPVFSGNTEDPSMVLSTGINGFVWNDANQNGQRDAVESGLGGRQVNLLNSNHNPVTYSGGVEPDDYFQGSILNTANPRVTISAIGSSTSSEEVSGRSRNETSTGIRVFCYRDANGSWNGTWGSNTRQLRMDFTSPVSSVSLDAVGYAENGRGRIRFYNVQGQPIGAYETGIIGQGEVETMHFSRPSDDIAYAIADSVRGYVIRFDNLDFEVQGITTTGPLGEYSFANIASGVYYVQVATSEDENSTSPSSGQNYVYVSDDAVSENINFGIDTGTVMLLPGDANLDGIVNDADATLLAANWQKQSGAIWAEGDFNNDGRVDDADATILATNWQRAIAPPSETPASEETPPTKPMLAGDANGDDIVDHADATILTNNWQKRSGATWAEGDFNGDGRVDSSDATILAANWQRAFDPPTSAPLAAPTIVPLIATPLLPGDANLDGTVNDADATVLATNWQKQSDATWSDGDFNGDGKVNDDDVAILAQHWMMTVDDLNDGDDDWNAVFEALCLDDDRIAFLD